MIGLKDQKQRKLREEQNMRLMGNKRKKEKREKGKNEKGNAVYNLMSSEVQNFWELEACRKGIAFSSLLLQVVDFV